MKIGIGIAISILAIGVMPCTKGKVVGFYEGWVGDREFPIDMAGFAFTVKQLKAASVEDNVVMPYSNSDQENGFLQRLNVSIKDLQPLAKQCTEVEIENILN